MLPQALSRLVLAGRSAFTAIRDPTRVEAVATLGDVTAPAALALLHTRMKEHPEGVAILLERPRVRKPAVDLQALGRLPEGTFGRAYFDYMAGNQFDPEARAEVAGIEDDELRYVMQRYREVHDFWHVLTGLPSSVLGEVTLKWLEMVQTGLPVAALSALFGPLTLSHEDRVTLLTRMAPWAVRTGRSCSDLMCVRYERLFDRPLHEVRRQLGLTLAPA